MARRKDADMNKFEGVELDVKESERDPFNFAFEIENKTIC